MLKNFIENKNAKLNIINDDVKLFPNPFSDELTISCKNAEEVTIYDLIGRMLFKTSLNDINDVHKINTKDLSSGLYIVKVKRIDKSLYTSKIIKE